MNETLTIDKFPSGQIFLPPSKSVGHRALICGVLSGGGTVNRTGENEDIQATIRCLKALGAKLSQCGERGDGSCGDGASGKRDASRSRCGETAGSSCGGGSSHADAERHGDDWRIEGGLPARMSGAPLLDCGESGSTLRFLIPLAVLYDTPVTFTGRGRLMQRPLNVYEKCLGAKGVTFTREDDRLTVRGPLRPGVFRLPGDVSSQFITGLLLALPLLSEDSMILLESPLQSASYVDLTMAVLRDYGIQIEALDHKSYRVFGNQRYRVRDYTVEADFSGAAFFLAAAALGRPLELMGLNLNSVQGDRAFLDLLKQCGYAVADGPHGGIVVTAGKGIAATAGNVRGRMAAADSAHGESAVVNRAHGEMAAVDVSLSSLVVRPNAITVDVGDIPDLVPPLAALLAFGRGESRIVNAGRLRIKESDRLATVTRQLNLLGADVTEGDDFLILRGKPFLSGGECYGENDHRIAMMCGVAAIGCKAPVRLNDYKCVKKSYPDFWNDFRKEKS